MEDKRAEALGRLINQARYISAVLVGMGPETASLGRQLHKEVSRAFAVLVEKAED